MIALDKNLFLLLFMFTSALFSQEYEEFDANADGKIDEKEFQNIFSENFSGWDHDGDGILTEKEFYDSVFDIIDANADGMLNSNEWDAGYSFIFGDFLGTPNSSQFDLNGDHKVSREEFHGSIRFSDFFSFYDENGDGSVELKEFNNGVFAHWDRDRNQYIEKSEYESFAPYF